MFVPKDIQGDIEQTRQPICYPIPCQCHSNLHAISHIRETRSPALDYFHRVKNLTDSLAAAGAPLHEDEIVTDLLTSLPKEYDSLMTLVRPRVESLLLSEVYANLLSFEMHLVSRKGAPSHAGGPAMNYDSRGGHGGRSGGRGGHNGGWNGGCGPSSGGDNNDHPRYQICESLNHTAPQCWYSYDGGYTKDEKALDYLIGTPSDSVDDN
jgi:hypothetical protein